METYVAALLDSALPFEPGVAVLLWIVLFFANLSVAISARDANRAQPLVSVEDWSAVQRGSLPLRVVAQLLYAGIVFALGYLLAPAAFVFFGGGLLISTACTLGLNAQSLLSSQAMAEPDAGKGALTYSTGLALRQLAHRLVGAALACFISAIALAHLALLGGAFFLATTAAGYVRRARRVRA